jgi:hypothetical protein
MINNNKKKQDIGNKTSENMWRFNHIKNKSFAETPVINKN